MNLFRKSERLCSRKSLGRLFSSGNSLFLYPFKLIWLDTDLETNNPAKLAISVPRRKFKKAVDRNRVKRLIRESYRLNKNILYENLIRQNRKIDLIIIYIADQGYDFYYLNGKMIELLSKFTDDPTDKEIL
jgi:ribonuclease P protein component